MGGGRSEGDVLSAKRLQKIVDRLNRAPHDVGIRRLKSYCEAFGRWEERSRHAVVTIEGSHPVTVPRHRKVPVFVVRQLVAAMEIYLVKQASKDDQGGDEGGGASDG